MDCYRRSFILSSLCVVFVSGCSKLEKELNYIAFRWLPEEEKREILEISINHIESAILGIEESTGVQLSEAEKRRIRKKIIADTVRVIYGRK